VGASCSVALGLNCSRSTFKTSKPGYKDNPYEMVLLQLLPVRSFDVFLMRGEEIRLGIDVYPVLSDVDKAKLAEEGSRICGRSLGKSKKAATLQFLRLP